MEKVEILCKQCKKYHPNSKATNCKIAETMGKGKAEIIRCPEFYKKGKE